MFAGSTGSWKSSADIARVRRRCGSSCSGSGSLKVGVIARRRRVRCARVWLLCAVSAVSAVTAGTADAAVSVAALPSDVLPSAALLSAALLAAALSAVSAFVFCTAGCTCCTSFGSLTPLSEKRTAAIAARRARCACSGLSCASGSFAAVSAAALSSATLSAAAASWASPTAETACLTASFTEACCLTTWSARSARSARSAF